MLERPAGTSHLIFTSRTPPPTSSMPLPPDKGVTVIVPSDVLTDVLPNDTVLSTGERGATKTRDAYLDNCKFALMILIGLGHSLQWLLTTEDRRTGRAWCGADVLDDSGPEEGVVTSSAMVPGLRALYTWSNAIAIPMFCVVSGRCSRSLVASSRDGDDRVADRLRRVFEQLIVPFLTFQALACVVYESAPALKDALAPGAAPSTGEAPVSGPFAEAGAAFDFWTPHISWYLLALALWRCVSVVTAQMNDVAVWVGALALGIGVGFTNTGAATGFFLKWGTIWGNFPYFVFGTFVDDDRYRRLRDASGAIKLACGAVTAVAFAVAWCGLRHEVLCFDLWQWEAWKSSPFVHYDQFTVDSAVEGVDASPRSLCLAAGFRAFTYIYAVVVGVAFLGSLPRCHVPLVTDSGTRTMYGYLTHAPALLLLLWLNGVFESAEKGGGLGWAGWLMWGVLAPIVVTEACMTAPVSKVFWWLCEPKLGKWVWR